MALPDWRSIGRHLKKRLDEIMNPSPRNPSPSPSERWRDREADAQLRGFVYFDNFDEVYAWAPADVDPIQVSNTPLIERLLPGDTIQKSKIILCHDYKGGYNEYESVNPLDSDREEYNCGYLQYVDTFIYFSHKLICCPPPSWINVCHRNGVKILGTFLVEPQTPDIERMLEQEKGSFLLASQLRAMAEKYGFDGWLLNIEKCFPKKFLTHDATSKLLRFVDCLKEEMGERKLVVWYDALTSDNEVRYQNGLTEKNLPFVKAAGSLFTNYKWTEEKARKAVEVAEKEGLNVGDIYFGVDVWAQNVDTKPPRITYPVKGGGGTGTGLAVEILTSLGLSTAIFAPGWTFEHFEFSNSAGVDRSMWSGGSLPLPLPCFCNPQKPHNLSDSSYVDHPITRFAQERPTGSEKYFFTDFQKAFNTSEQGVIRSVLGSQSPMPKCLPLPRWEYEKPPQTLGRRFLYGDHKSTFSIWATSINPDLDTNLSSPVSLDLELFSVSMLIQLFSPLHLQLAYVRHRENLNDTTQIELTLQYSDAEWDSPQYQRQILYYDPKITNDQFYTARFPVCPLALNSGTRLTAIGVRCSFGDNPPLHQRLVTLKRLSILPNDYVCPTADITDIHIITQGKVPNRHERLSWDFRVSHSPHFSSTGVPWSSMTGPFSHFQISLGDRVLGNAFASQFVFTDRDFEETARTGSCDVAVEGFFFGGGSVRRMAKLQRPTLVQEAEQEDWVHV